MPTFRFVIPITILIIYLHLHIFDSVRHHVDCLSRVLDGLHGFFIERVDIYILVFEAVQPLADDHT